MKNRSVKNEIIPVVLPGEKNPIKEDNGPRDDTNPEKLGKLKPAFDKKYGPGD
ncbi:MAG: hypothetical protein HF978_08865 [Desulfobacteraceae bacterium]|nr:hypothetical protein [Desulfobacteraceae bacterium]MBC2755644.1 hypothetical protein [Desulfobacteraceae bacterium]